MTRPVIAPSRFAPSRFAPSRFALWPVLFEAAVLAGACCAWAVCANVAIRANAAQRRINSGIIAYFIADSPAECIGQTVSLPCVLFARRIESDLDRRFGAAADGDALLDRSCSRRATPPGLTRSHHCVARQIVIPGGQSLYQEPAFFVRHRAPAVWIKSLSFFITGRRSDRTDPDLKLPAFR